MNVQHNSHLIVWSQRGGYALSARSLQEGIGMGRTAFHRFRDPDEYTAHVRATTDRIVVSGRGSYGAELVQAELGQALLQRATQNLPYIGTPRSIRASRPSPCLSMRARR